MSIITNEVDYEDLAARTLAAIDGPTLMAFWVRDADRERVASDVRAIERAEKGLREHTTSTGWCMVHLDPACLDARRYAEARDEAWQSLKRTARLYGVVVGGT